MPSKKRNLLSRLAKCSTLLLFWEVGEFIIIIESEWNLISLVVDMMANLAQWLQIFPSVRLNLKLLRLL